MVLKVVEALADKFFPYKYAWHILIALVTAIVLRAFSQGRTTNRERDLHDRTFLVTGGFTPLGLTLLQNLAQRGAKIIALSPHPIDSPAVTILVSLLRTTYNNENIFAEQCQLSDPDSIRRFCMRFLTEGETDDEKSKSQPKQDSKGSSQSTSKDKPKTTTDSRLDGIIFAHEYQHVGIPRFLRNKKPAQATISHDEEEETQRESNSLATFLITTLLLPALLVAPVERDIRIVNVVNPFYAAAAASVRASKNFDPAFSRLIIPSTSSTTSLSPPPPATKSLFLTEGLRSLRTIIFTRHLQRIFDALPKPQVPKTEEGSSSVPIISARMQRSNIVAVSVSPGLSRVDTVSRMLNADWSLVESGDSVERKFSWIGVLLYALLLPLLHICTKSPKAAIQSILQSLFLPTPFKILSQPVSNPTPEASKENHGDGSNTTTPSQPTKQPTSLIREEVLKPGALYAECAVVNLDLSLPAPPSTEPEDRKEGTSNKGKEKVQGLKEEVLEITDDGEYGGEIAGRVVWEAYEAALKVWEKSGSGKPGSKKDP